MKTGSPFCFICFVFVLLILFCSSKDFTLAAEPFFCLLDFGVLERTLSHKKKTKALFATRELLLHWRERERCAAILLFATTALMETVCFLVLFCFCLMFFGVPPHNPSISIPQRLQCHDIPAI